VARALEQGGVKVDLAKGDLFPQRMVKGADEVRKITESQQAAVIATRAAVAMIARAEIDGRGYLRNRGTRLTSEDVKRAIAKVLLDHDCVCPDAIVAGGRQGADPHETGSGPLRAGEPIVLDIFPQHTGHGYWGDLTRTVVRGVPSNRVRKMYAAVRAAQSAALSLVRAGARYARVHGGAVEEFKRRGFGPRPAEEKREGFIHSTGHGLGLSIHEAPAVGKADGRLVAGNVITVEPGLYYSDLGGVRIEDTVLVTRTGWQYLVPCEKRFEV
jgi:Xaa-Pro aminopeptidase